MNVFRLRGRRRRYLSLMTVAATAAACVLIAPATPASAEPGAATHVTSSGLVVTPNQFKSGNEICLTNANTYCVGFDFKTVLDAAVEIANLGIIIWVIINKGKKSDNPDKGDDDEELKVANEANGEGVDAGLCLAATGGLAHYTTCGANGTVWVEVPHSNGHYLVSRWSLDHGNPNSTLSIDPLRADSDMFVYTPQSPGSPFWQTFSEFPTSHTG